MAAALPEETSEGKTFTAAEAEASKGPAVNAALTAESFLVWAASTEESFQVQAASAAGSLEGKATSMVESFQA